MSAEKFTPYNERDVTVVGGNGRLGRKVVAGLEQLDFKRVRVCEKDDSFPKFVEKSTDIFFAVDDATSASMLEGSLRDFGPQHTILDGSSVKSPRMIQAYRELDSRQASAISTHLGVAPAQPWRGAKVWVCEVGPNSERAKQLAFDLFVPANTSIRVIDIDEHKKVEQAQSLTVLTTHILADALRSTGLPLGEFDDKAALTAELEGLAMSRVLGQGSPLSAEIIFDQSLKEELAAALLHGTERIISALGDKERLEKLMQELTDFHNQDGAVSRQYLTAGVIAARLANFRRSSMSFVLLKDEPGQLIKILEPFHEERVNINAIDSMPIEPTKKQAKKSKIAVEFHVGIDTESTSPKKERKIKAELRKLGCIVN